MHSPVNLPPLTPFQNWHTTGTGYRPLLTREQKILIAVFAPIVAPWVRLELRTLQTPWQKGPCIFVFNHNNGFETVLAAYLLMVRLGAGPTHFLVDWMYGRIPLLGWLLNRFDPIYVYNKPARYRWLERMRHRRRPGENGVIPICLRRLREGRHLALFPEGRRNTDPRFLLRGRLGSARLARAAGVPIVPVGIVFNSGRKGRRIAPIGRAIFRVGKPLEMAHGTENVNERSVLYEFTAEIMASLALLCGKQVAADEPDSRSSLRINQNSFHRGDK